VAIESVGVVGCGLMGSGIAEVTARAGLDVTVHEPTAELLESGRERIVVSMDRALAREKLTVGERDAAKARLSFSTALSALASCDLVVEAIVEDPTAKKALFTELDGLCGPTTILASNTSSLPIADMAAATRRADRFVGLHFFNPVPVMRLVEVVRTLATSEETLAAAHAFVELLGKVPIAARDVSGFVVNLLLVPYLLDSIRQLERGVASVSDIDTGMVLGCGHPMGPLTLCDFVGIDTLSRISEIMYEEYREERYAPPPLLRRLVAMGRLGRKSGQGFYDWTGDEPVSLPIR
jgi:3-hydroxybutyryl-CoA dehydrogenase